MRRAEVVYRPAALADIRDIYRWIFERSQEPAVAKRFTDRLLDACEKLGSMPFGGAPRDDLAVGLRTFPFERRAVIAYFVEGDFVHISNIFYGGRDYDALYHPSGTEPR